MPGRDLLQRFRPAGAPGPVAPVGVPIDPRARLEDELAPVFLALAAAAEQAADIGARAAEEAAQIEEDALANAATIVADAQAHLPAERAAAAASVRALSERQLADLLAAGRDDADRVSAVGTTRLDSLVEAAVTAIWRSAGSSTGQEPA